MLVCVKAADTLVDSPPLKRRRAAKVRGTALSPDMEMHRFVNQVKGKHRSWKPSNPISEWKGVYAIHEKVLEIDWENLGIRGTLDFICLPSSLNVLSIKNDIVALEKLSGAPRFDKLPESLSTLELINHSFSGQVDLTHLPLAITYFDISGNRFTGTVDLTALPPNLGTLLLSRNALKGDVCLTKLPLSLVVLSLGENTFTGSLDLTQLSGSLHTLELEWNKFEGVLDLRKLPPSIQRIDICMSGFDGYEDDFVPDVVV
eukprot:CAMPEP_0201478150 /NCGR_PEP_ID=MMETSP0151_2-20130828/3066_1 /ASSEMBLY_ACC=CAM_ASM_000257 /TAXON_ID=200890 /ORGANISM="Paramoeba atlantica, Strain 621/1 / CCAP 1560/9" /LENGTH=258 /DNA_ID=CAMNT_0047859145 /DNA_START=48 /DNA_END=824 /DNA_ORIENTATION=-